MRTDGPASENLSPGVFVFTRVHFVCPQKRDGLLGTGTGERGVGGGGGGTKE